MKLQTVIKKTLLRCESVHLKVTLLKTRYLCRCENIRKEFPDVDVATGGRLIQGLVVTKEWRQSLVIMDSLKLVDNPPLCAYTAIMKRALQEEDEELYWKLANDMVLHLNVLSNEIFTSYFAFCEKKFDTFNENINKILTFVGDNEILLPLDVVNQLQNVFQKFGFTSRTTVFSDK